MSKDLRTWEGRRILSDNLSATPEVLIKAGRELLDQNLLSDAIVCFSRAKNNDGLKAVIDQSVREGNFFLFKEAASKLNGEKAARHKLEELINAAKNNGLSLYMEQAQKYLEENY